MMLFSYLPIVLLVFILRGVRCIPPGLTIDVPVAHVDQNGDLRKLGDADCLYKPSSNFRNPDLEKTINPRAWPLRQEFNKLRKEVKNSPKTHVFYSGETGGKTVHAQAQQHATNVGGSTINQDIKAAGVKQPDPKTTDPKYHQKWWDLASKTKATHAKGHVHAVLGDNVDPKSVWNRVEKPALMKNNQVVSIKQVNADTGKGVKMLKGKRPR